MNMPKEHVNNPYQESDIPRPTCTCPKHIYFNSFSQYNIIVQIPLRTVNIFLLYLSLTLYNTQSLTRIIKYLIIIHS